METRNEDMILNEMKKLLSDLHNRLDSVGNEFDWDEFINISNKCRELQIELKNQKII
jgi:hypothetical protein